MRKWEFCHHGSWASPVYHHRKGIRKNAIIKLSTHAGMPFSSFFYLILSFFLFHLSFHSSFTPFFYLPHTHLPICSVLPPANAACCPQLTRHRREARRRRLLRALPRHALHRPGRNHGAQEEGARALLSLAYKDAVAAAADGDGLRGRRGCSDLARHPLPPLVPLRPRRRRGHQASVPAQALPQGRGCHGRGLLVIRFQSLATSSSTGMTPRLPDASPPPRPLEASLLRRRGRPKPARHAAT